MDDELINETFDQYDYMFPLNMLAVGWGLAITLFLTMLIVSGLFGCVKCAEMIGRKKNQLKSL